MSMNVENLNSFEKDELLRWFLYWLPMDKRAELMRRYPQSYNKMVPPEEGQPELLTVVQRASGPEKGVSYIVDGERTDRVPERPVAKPACER